MESKDLKHYLMGNKSVPSKKIIEKTNKQKDNKEMQNIFNPNKNIKSLFTALDNERDQLFYNVWNKLEKGIKLNRLLDYLYRKSIEYNMDQDIIEKNKQMLLLIFNENNFNKLSDVKYNSELGEIESLHKINIDTDTLLFINN